ncbi:MAG: MBL fold metallo-hydrolase, partial [Sphingomicrobium sp.]
MFVSLLAAAAAAAQVVTIPLGKSPRQVERPIAPIETAGPLFDGTCKDWDEWDKPAPPVRIHGNTYLVGTCGISAVLITGSAGHVLIDTGTEAGADLIARNIRALGFRLEDVRYLLHSHEHLDHVGGIARLQQLTGARLVASPAAAAV